MRGDDYTFLYILDSGKFSDMIDSSPKFQRMVALKEF